MVLVIKKGATKKEISKIEKQISESSSKSDEKIFNAERFNGVLPSLEDPIAIQKELRDEWDRDFR